MKRKDIVIYFLLQVLLIFFGTILMVWQIHEQGEATIDLRSIGGSIIATGVVGCFMFWATYINTNKSLQNQKILNKIEDCGIQNIFNKRILHEEYKAQRKKTKKNYDIMGFGLRTFIEDNISYLPEWSKIFEIRILLINPTHPMCDQRDYEENDKIGKIKEDVIFSTKKILALNTDRVQVRWYTATPVTNILRMDDVMWVGPYFMKKRSRNAYVLELRKGGKLFDQYLEHFETVWDDPKLSCTPKLKRK